MERHQRDDPLLVAKVVLLGEQRELLEELLDRALLGGGVVLARHAHELLEVLEPALRLDRALGLERLGVAGLLERLREQVADPAPPSARSRRRSMTDMKRPTALIAADAEARHRVGLGRDVPDRLADRVRVAHEPALRGVRRCPAAASSPRARTRPCRRGSRAASGRRARP